jgi:hypothetical protein
VVPKISCAKGRETRALRATSSPSTHVVAERVPRLIDVHLEHGEVGWAGAVPAVAEAEDVPSEPPDDGLAEAGQRIRIGVPIGIRCASRTIAALRTRMHPCDGRPGISSGWFVPWMPTTPPPGHSDSEE